MTDTPVPVQPALSHCPGCDEYGASHTTPSIEHPAVPAKDWPTHCTHGKSIEDETCEECQKSDLNYRPAGPAQEAPREPIDTLRDSLGRLSNEAAGMLGYGGQSLRDLVGNTNYAVLEAKINDARVVLKMTEPQAGAQVPSQDAASVALTGVKEAIYSEWEHRALSDPRFIWQWMLDRAAASESHLNSIKSYATEAAKTPITREDMHDPLKAQTFWDEAKGLERLVLAEIGGGQ